MRRISTNSVLTHLSETPSSGLTSLQNQADQLTGQFLAQATDWKSLAAMMAGGLAYRLGKIGTISIGTGHVTAMPLRTLSVAFGLGSEVTAYEFTNRVLQTVGANLVFALNQGRSQGSPLPSPNPNLWSFSGPGGWKQGWLSSLVTFGTLKGFGKLAEGQNLILQHASQSLGMVVGHQLLSRAGIGEKPEGTLSEQLIHAEATNLQLSAGMALGHALTEGRLLALERGLDLVMTHSRANGRAPLQTDELGLAIAGVNSVPRVGAIRESPLRDIKINPSILLSATEGNGPKMQDADPPRVGTSPPEEKQLHGLEAPTLRDPIPPDEPSLSFPKEVVAPQFTQHLDIDEKTLEKMEAFPGQVKEQHEKSGEANPVYFGLNHLKWWMGLIQKHVGALGAEAIVLGGKILFGRFQEDSKGQEEVENDLKLLAHDSKATLRNKSPQPESWWRPVWESAVGGAQGEGEILAAILQQLPGDSFYREMADQWLMEIAIHDFERSELIREKAMGDPIPLEGQVPPKFIYSLQDFHPLILKDDWARVNEKLAELYQQALGFPNLSETIMGILAIKETLHKNMAFKEDLEAIKLRKKKANPTVPTDVQKWKGMDSNPIHKGIGMRWEALLANLEFICDRRNNRGFTLGGEEGRLEAIALAALAFVQKALNDPTAAEALLKKARERATSYYQNREGSIRPSQGGLNRLLDEINSFETHSKWMGRSIPWSAEVQKVLKEAEAENWSQAFKDLNQITDKFFQPIALALLAKVAKEKGVLKIEETSPIPPSDIKAPPKGAFPPQFKKWKIGQQVEKIIKGKSESEIQYDWANQATLLAALGFALQQIGRDPAAEKLFDQAKQVVDEESYERPRGHDTHYSDSYEEIEKFKNGIWPDFKVESIQGILAAEADVQTGNWDRVFPWIDHLRDPLSQALGLAYLVHKTNEIQTAPSPAMALPTHSPQIPQDIKEEIIRSIRRSKPPREWTVDGNDFYTAVAAEGYIHHRLGETQKAQQIWKKIHPMTNLNDILSLKDGTWTLDPYQQGHLENLLQHGNLEDLVKKGDISAALHQLETITHYSEKALGLAYLTKLLTEGIQASTFPKTFQAPPREKFMPPSSPLPKFFQEFMQEQIEYLQDMYAVDSPALMLGGAVFHAGLGCILNVLGNTTLAAVYFQEAERQLEEGKTFYGKDHYSFHKAEVEKWKDGSWIQFVPTQVVLEELLEKGDINALAEKVTNQFHLLRELKVVAFLAKKLMERINFPLPKSILWKNSPEDTQGIPQNELSFDEVVKQYLATVPEEKAQKTETTSPQKVNLPQETIEAFERILNPVPSDWGNEERHAEEIKLDDIALLYAAEGYIYQRLGNTKKSKERFEEADHFGIGDSRLREEIESFKNGTWAIDLKSIPNLKEAEKELRSNNLKAALALLPREKGFQGSRKKSLFLAHLIKILTEEQQQTKSFSITSLQNLSQTFEDFFDHQIDSLVDQIEKEKGKSSWQELALTEAALEQVFQNRGASDLAIESYWMAEDYIQKGRSRGETFNSLQKDIFKKLQSGWNSLPTDDARLRNEFKKGNFPALSAEIEKDPHLLSKALYLVYLSNLWSEEQQLKLKVEISQQTEGRDSNTPIVVASDPMMKIAATVPRKPPNYFATLPLRDIDSIPEEYWHLIPQPKNKVLFESFQRILNETAFLINAPDRIAIRLFGPPGTAKTTIPEMIAGKMQLPLLRFPFSKRTDPSDLEGLWTREEVDGQIVPVFKEGAPTVAMEHGFHLVLDEPDLARPGVLAYINNISAPGEFAWVRKKNGNLEKIKIHEDYRVWATENGVQQVAREEHGKDFLRRFVPYHVGAWTKEEITTVLAELYENYSGKNRWNRKTTELLALFHEKMATLAKGMQDQQTKVTLTPLGSGVGQQVEFTPRSILRVAQRLIAGGPLTPESLSRAIRAEYILPLADKQDRELVWGQAQAIFRPLAQERGWSPDAIGAKSIPVPTFESISQKYLGERKISSDNFVWTDQALRLADEILWNRSLGIDVMLLGEAGEGKTELPGQIAKLLDLPYYQKTISSETDEEDLVGGIGRINGKIGFIPDLVTLGTEKGGIVHLDEYLLGETGKLEALMNPLMDDAKSLILKNPYRLIPRHSDTFFILTSNPPFREYADRNEHSGAAMSRVAVIYLADDFGMQPKDRVKILKNWAERPISLGDSGKKKNLEP